MKRYLRYVWCRIRGWEQIVGRDYAVVDGKTVLTTCRGYRTPDGDVYFESIEHKELAP